MWIGDPHSRQGTHHLIWEVLANSVDEFLAGRASKIDVILHADSSVSVHDDGAGISLKQGKDGLSWLEEVLTTFHSTATADGHAPHVHLRRHQVGLVAVSALSSALRVDVHSAGAHFAIELARGVVVKPLHELGPSSQTGTVLRFTPDPSIFAYPRPDAERVAQRVRELSMLLPGLQTTISVEAYEYPASYSIAEFLRPQFSKDELIVGEYSEGSTVGRVAFAWSQGYDAKPAVRGYCNLDEVPSGSHLEGFRRGLAAGLDRRDGDKVYNALAVDLNAVVSALVIDPAFYGPTHERLISSEAEHVVHVATADALRRAREEQPGLAAFLEGRLRGCS